MLYLKDIDPIKDILTDIEVGLRKAQESLSSGEKIAAISDFLAELRPLADKALISRFAMSDNIVEEKKTTNRKTV